jgi:phage gpG-like protein
MSLVTVQFTSDPLVAVLEKYDMAGRNLRDVMGVIADDLVSRGDENFQTEGVASPSGKWQELAESTIRQRRKKGKGAKILQDTGRMAGSLNPEHGDDFAEVYTNDERAPFHVSKDPRDHIPLRDFMDIDLEEVQREAAEDLLAQIVGV